VLGPLGTGDKDLDAHPPAHATTDADNDLYITVPKPATLYALGNAYVAAWQDSGTQPTAADCVSTIESASADGVPLAKGTVVCARTELAGHVQAMKFDADTSRLDVVPDAAAYGTKLRWSAPKLIAAANEQVKGVNVRTLHVLPPPPSTARPTTAATDPGPQPGAPAGPVKTRETASEGYRRALAAHQAGQRNRVVNPAIRATSERQTRKQVREPEELFGDDRQALEELRAKADREGSVDASRALALQRLAAERTGLPSVKAAPAAVPFSRTA